MLRQIDVNEGTGGEFFQGLHALDCAAKLNFECVGDRLLEIHAIDKEKLLNGDIVGVVAEAVPSMMEDYAEMSAMASPWGLTYTLATAIDKNSGTNLANWVPTDPMYGVMKYGAAGIRADNPCDRCKNIVKSMLTRCRRRHGLQQARRQSWSDGLPFEIATAASQSVMPLARVYRIVRVLPWNDDGDRRIIKVSL